LIEMSESLQERRRKFFLRTARAWQNYLDISGLLPGIHPSDEQKTIIEQEDDQLLINGSAGSGKSITLMYKLLRVMKQEEEEQRILYVTFNQTLLDDTKKRLRASNVFQELKEKHRLHLFTFHQLARYLLNQMGYQHLKKVDCSIQGLKKMEEDAYLRIAASKWEIEGSPEYKKLPAEERLYKTHTDAFLGDELMWMKANGLIHEEDYLQVERTGRSNNPRLTRQQRKTVFKIFKKYQENLEKKYHRALDLEDYALELLKVIPRMPERLFYDYIFIDEVQDLQPMQILALAKLRKKKIVLTGDSKQRIYKSSPHSYHSLGLQLSGRNRTLKQNFRSTKQIMTLAESLKFEDVENDRLDHLTFVREGEKPVISYYPSPKKMADEMIRKIKGIRQKDPSASIAIIHRYEQKKGQGNALLQYLNRHFYVISTKEYHRKFDHQKDKKPVFFTDVFSVKGLEFDHVFVIHFDADHYPSKKRRRELAKQFEGDELKQLESESFQKDFNRLLSDEKKLLYVALTRAKHTLQLMYTAKSELGISPFVRDFPTTAYQAVHFNKSKYDK
jgi:DNA helicase-2/ATP-dependent DNA helicase PcrA